MAFSEVVRSRALLWCDRHCCVCKKACGVYIEVHHIDEEEKPGRDDMDNAIPLCFECHSHVAHYNVGHPRGTKYKHAEQKKRREQVYEEFTRHLVPPIHYEVTQRSHEKQSRKLPDVGFNLTHHGRGLPVKVRVSLEIALGRKRFGSPDSPYYNGRKLWHLNPYFSHRGHFGITEKALTGRGRLQVTARVTIIDCYEREHALLPVGHVYRRRSNEWYFEP